MIKTEFLNNNWPRKGTLVKFGETNLQISINIVSPSDQSFLTAI